MCALFSITSEEAATAVSPFSLYPVSITESPAAALPKAADGMTRIHLRDLRTEIARILDTGK